jgi:hypothetical protein
MKLTGFLLQFYRTYTINQMMNFILALSALYLPIARFNRVLYYCFSSYFRSYFSFNFIG